MALKSTIFKAALQVADLNRNHYGDYALTVARHPSETDERMMVRLLAFALNAEERLSFGKGLSDEDEPDLLNKDLTGTITHWIDVGQPDERRILRACGRAARVTVYAYANSTEHWWKSVADKLERARNLAVWRIPTTSTQALAAIAARNMKLQCTVQDGEVWFSDDATTIQVTPVNLKGVG